MSMRNSVPMMADSEARTEFAAEAIIHMHMMVLCCPPPHYGRWYLDSREPCPLASLVLFAISSYMSSCAATALGILLAYSLPPPACFASAAVIYLFVCLKQTALGSLGRLGAC